MKTFLQWIESENLDLSVIVDTPKSKKSSIAERIQQNINANYPAAYRRAQYPDEYHMPLGADQGYKLGPGQQVKKVADTAAK